MITRRRGVASVVGTVFFVLVFMLALGSLAYSAALQEQTASAEAQAVQAAAQRGSEDLGFVMTGAGPAAVDRGPATVVVNHLILRFPNGTVYALPASASLPPGGELSLAGLVPGGVCTPGTATCASKYSQIASGDPPGSALGLVTSLGNVFWYAYPETQGGDAGFAAWVRSTVRTVGTGVYSSTTLAEPLAPGTYAFYAFTAIEPETGIERYNFEIHALPSGSSLVLACAPLAYPVGGGNQPTDCVTTAGVPIAAPNTLGFGVSPPVYATPGVFGVVTIGATPGSLQIDFACVQDCGSVSILEGSVMVVQPLS